MADVKISALNALGTAPEANDKLVIVDVSAGETKRVDVEFLNKHPDNVKSTWGSGDDLEIYHDGSNSYISDQGTGDLRMQVAGLDVQTLGGISYLNASSNRVILKHTGNDKLTTTSTGVDVTGTLTADGLTVDSAQKLIYNANNSQAGSRKYQLRNDDVAFGDFGIKASTSNSTEPTLVRFNINNGGDVSFYEDTGTTAKFFWDASAESLGIGTTSPSSALDVIGDIEVSGGVVFGSTGGAVTSKTLDDYEEGTWTPALDSVTSGPTAGASASYTGSYTRIGKLVHVRFRILFDNAGTTVALDDRFVISGLPFAVESLTYTGVGTALIYSGVSTGDNAFCNLSVTSTGEKFLVYITHVDGTVDYADAFQGEFTYEID
jgi:hypothetical protein